MREEESVTIVEMIQNHWPGSHWTAATMDAYARAIEPLDADVCTQAVITAVNELDFYPKVSTLREFYYLERAKVRAREDKPDRWPAKRETVPLWVRRWVAARYLHKMFGKDQDMRRFTEQGDWGNPDVALMPASAWLEEAEHVTDARVWEAIGR